MTEEQRRVARREAAFEFAREEKAYRAYKRASQRERH